jgi:hypothetical protein
MIKQWTQTNFKIKITINKKIIEFVLKLGLNWPFILYALKL